MTAIIIWYTDNEIMCCSDSLITTKMEKKKVISNASKVLQLNVECKYFSEIKNEKEYFKKAQTHVLGYCYSGNALICQNAYLTLSTFLRHLKVTNEKHFPNLNQIGKYIYRFLTLEFNEIKHLGEISIFEISVFGYCKFAKEYYVFNYKVEKNDKSMFEVKMYTETDLKYGDFYLLGDKKKIIENRVKAGLSAESKPGFSPKDTPRRILQKIIEDKEFQSIGGYLEIGRVTTNNFNLYTHVYPSKIDGKMEINHKGKKWEELALIDPKNPNIMMNMDATA